MPFSRTFPVTAWIWRTIRGRAFGKTVIFLASILVVTALGFRIEAVAFQHRVNKTLSQLKKVQVGRTTQTELLQLLPVLNKIKDPYSGLENGDEQFEFRLQNIPEGGMGFGRVSPLIYSGPFHRLTYLVGYRPRIFIIQAIVHMGVVSYIESSLLLSPPENQYPNMMIVRVSSPIAHFRHVELTISEEHSRHFSVSRYFKWRKWDIEASFSPDASDELKAAAFDLHLECNWSLYGCSDAAQVLPFAEQKRLEIRNAAIARIHSNDPCPLTILPAKVRDAEGIWILRIKSVKSTAVPFPGEGPQPGLAIEYELVQQLLRNPTVSPDLSTGWIPETAYVADQLEQNPATRFFIPGNSLIFFYGRGADGGSPCDHFPYSPSALKIVSDELSHHRSRH